MIPPANLKPHPALATTPQTTAADLSPQYNPNAKPILALRMPDGDHLIVSGRTRHQIALADPTVKAVKTSLIDYDPSIHTDDWVLMTNAGEHIINRTATTEHYRTYFTLNPITHAQAIEQGLVPIDPATAQPTAAYIKGRQEAEHTLAAKAEAAAAAAAEAAAAAKAKAEKSLPGQTKWNTPSPKSKPLSEQETKQTLISVAALGLSKYKNDRFQYTHTLTQRKGGTEYTVATDGRRITVISQPTYKPDTDNTTQEWHSSKGEKSKDNQQAPMWTQVIPARFRGETTIDLSYYSFLGKGLKGPAKDKHIDSPLLDNNKYIVVNATDGFLSLNSIYVRDAYKQIVELGKKLGFSPIVKLQYNDAISPVRFSAEHNGIKWQYVLMPVHRKHEATPGDIILGQQPTIYGQQDTASFSLRAIKAPLVSNVDAAKEALKKIQGKTFTNGEVTATVSGQTIGKTHAAHMSVRNLKALGYDENEARNIHYSACTKIHEVFESAEYKFFEPNYDTENKKGRAGAWHYFGIVDVEGYGEFDVNVTANKPVNDKEGNRLYTLELTIENPSAQGQDTLSQRGLSLDTEGSSVHRLAAYQSFVEKEMAEIKKKAIETDTFMLAPNGKQSNLNERQWLHVRTAAFKKWFGDWENDPANASKVVDENGEPLVAYRGARVDEGNVLGVSLSPKQQRELHVNDYTNNYYPGAIWLSDSAFTAQTYMQQYALDDRAEAKEARVDAAYENGGELYTVDDTEFLFSGQYVSPSGKVMYKREALVTSRLAKSLFAEGNGLEGHFYLRRKGEGISVDTKSWVIANKRIPYPTSHQDAVNKANEELHSIDEIEVAANSRLYACFVNAKNPYYYDFKGEQFSEMGRKLRDALNDGYDALLALNVKDPGSYENRKRVRPAMTIGVISSAQIKSATDNRGTYSAASNDISFSLRRSTVRNAASLMNERETTLLRVANYIKREAARTANIMGRDTELQRAGVAFAQANAIINSLDTYIFPKEYITKNSEEYRRLRALRNYLSEYIHIAAKGKLPVRRTTKDGHITIKAAIRELLEKQLPTARLP